VIAAVIALGGLWWMVFAIEDYDDMSWWDQSEDCFTRVVLSL
jgi:hypothetical protein